MAIKDDNHQRSLAQSLFQAWKDELYCDVTIHCGAQSVKAHKLVLLSISDYFKYLFKYGNDQEEKHGYTLDESIINEHCLHNIIQFAYTGELSVNTDSVQDLLVAANYLQIDILTQKCERFILNNIKEYENEDILHLIPFANKLSLQSLLDPICRRVSENFCTIIKEQAISQLSIHDIKTLLKNRDLTVLDHGIPVMNPEVDILKLIGLYLSVKSPTESSNITELLADIQFDEIEKSEDLKSVIKSFPVLECPKIQEIICIREIQFLDTGIVVENSVCVNHGDERRTFSNYNKFLKYGREYGRLIASRECSSARNVDKNDRPVKFTVWVRKQDHTDLSNIHGISIQYHSGEVAMHGEGDKNPVDIFSEHVFKLDENEVVTKIVIRTSYENGELSSMTFVSNFGREYGPFGNNEGREQTVFLPRERGYLHSLVGRSPLLGSYLSCVQCRWVYFRTNETHDDDDDDDNNNDDDDDDDDEDSDNQLGDGPFGDRVFCHYEEDSDNSVYNEVNHEYLF